MKRGQLITSRIGKTPMPIPPEATVRLEGTTLLIQGPHGTDRHDPSRHGFKAVIDRQTIRLEPLKEQHSNNRLVGLERALITNLMRGVVRPFLRSLELRGTGFRAELTPQGLTLRLGFSHPVIVTPPPGMEVSIEKQTIIHLRSHRLDQLGAFAASLRALRPPDPYKGKGVRYLGEVVSLKPGKAAKAIAV